MEKGVKVAFVLPCYNEELIIESTVTACLAKLNSLKLKFSLDTSSSIILVDDGSKDKTWSLITKACQSFAGEVKGLKLAKNAGHQNALFAGLMYAKEEYDCVISLDADLQDDINVIDEMIAKFLEGSQIVYGVRNSRGNDTFFKKFTAQLFYKLMLFMGVNIIADHADYRLVSKRVLNELADYRESNLFLRAIFPLLGFQTDKVYYERLDRMAGETKYPLSKMLAFAWDGITSFSVSPLRYITIIGFVAMFVSFMGVAWVLFTKFTGNAVPGWSSIVLPIYFISGLQIASIGILGEYIGKIYKETKRRPKYIVEKVV
jgi:glycosyltransferase involved in cell wall biosynthesis